jgi:predicted lipoprotein with Yx(FWY)xxD motif
MKFDDGLGRPAMKMWMLAAATLALSALLLTACGGGDDSKDVALGNLTADDHGTKDVSGETSIELEADSNYFNPTFLRGEAGQSITLKLSNESDTLHNFSVPALAIDQDLQGKQDTEVEVTFPQSGVLLFLCKYHTSAGMNGELLVGDAQPEAASAAVAQPTLKVATNASLGNILTDASGKTLYLYKNDVPNSGKSTVSGNLAVAWPPLVLANGEPIKPQGAGGSLTLITRDDGSKQVAYNGMPLYYFNRDAAPGDVNGQGVGNVWYVVNP